MRIDLANALPAAALLTVGSRPAAAATFLLLQVAHHLFMIPAGVDRVRWIHVHDDNYEFHVCEFLLHAFAVGCRASRQVLLVC